MHKHLVAALAILAVAALAPRADAAAQQKKAAPIAAPHAVAQTHTVPRLENHAVHPVFAPKPVAHGLAPGRRAFDARPTRDPRLARQEEVRRQEQIRRDERIRHEEHDGRLHRYHGIDNTAYAGDTGADTSDDASADTTTGGSTFSDQLSSFLSLLQSKK